MKNWTNVELGMNILFLAEDNWLKDNLPRPKAVKALLFNSFLPPVSTIVTIHRSRTFLIFVMTRESVAVSAPGKVLFAGGFLVLDRAHTGLVFGLNARIHVHVREGPVNAHGNDVKIAVKSPQFRNARWLYSWNEHEGQLDQIKS